MQDEFVFWTTYKPLEHHFYINENDLREYFSSLDDVIKIMINYRKLAAGFVNNYIKDYNWDNIPHDIQSLIIRIIKEKYISIQNENTQKNINAEIEKYNKYIKNKEK